jgi:choice-of-anchor B domain-containing protein
MRRIIFLLFLICISEINYSQGFNMVKKSNLLPHPTDEYGAVFGYTDAQNNEFAIIGSESAIHVYDVNDCSNPVHVVSFSDGDNTIWREFATYQNFVYSVCDVSCDTGLSIINMDNQSITYYNTVFTKAHTIFIEQSQGRLYVMGSRNASNQNRLLIYTLDTEVVNGITYAGTPQNPVLVREFLCPYIHDMFVKDNIGYASLIYNRRFRMWNLSNPANIIELDNYVHTDQNHSSWMHNDGLTLFEAVEVPKGKNLFMFRKDNTTNTIDYVGEFKEPLEYPLSNQVTYHNPHINGNYMYISSYEDGVQVFDVSNVASHTTVKRIAYYDTYHQNNGSGYPSGYNGCWGVYPFLPSGCILASDITNGLFTMNLDLPVSNGNLPGKTFLSKNTDFIFERDTLAIVLRSEKGYCFRLTVDNSGSLITTRIICDDNNIPATKLEKNDLAFDNFLYSVVFKNPNGDCRKLKINTSGQLLTEQTTCTNTSQQVKFQNGDLIINTPTKGLILKDERNFCYRILVNNDGTLTSKLLITCPN